MRSTLKNTPRVSLFDMHTIMISLTNSEVMLAECSDIMFTERSEVISTEHILTLNVIRGHWRSKEVKSEYTLRYSIVDMHNTMISLTNIIYGIFTLKVI